MPVTIQSVAVSPVDSVSQISVAIGTVTTATYIDTTTFGRYLFKTGTTVDSGGPSKSAQKTLDIFAQRRVSFAGEDPVSFTPVVGAINGRMVGPYCEGTLFLQKNGVMMIASGTPAVFLGTGMFVTVHM